MPALIQTPELTYLDSFDASPSKKPTLVDKAVEKDRLLSDDNRLKLANENNTEERMARQGTAKLKY